MSKGKFDKNPKFHFVNFLKQITPHESTSKEISFEWWHHRILSTEVKLRTTSQTPSSTLAVKGLKRTLSMAPLVSGFDSTEDHFQLYILRGQL